MKLKRVLKLSPKNAIIILLISVVIWNEYLALKLQSFSWSTPTKTDKSFSILIVADPQLIGYRNEPHFIGWLSRWDADRFVLLYIFKFFHICFEVSYIEKVSDISIEDSLQFLRRFNRN